MVFLQLGKELPSESIGELSSSPESAESSLSQTNSLTEVINDWRRELEEKNCMLKDRNSLIQSLEEQLKHRDEEISDMRESHQSIELDRDRNCQMVSLSLVMEKSDIRRAISSLLRILSLSSQSSSYF